jgi:ATP-dependent Lhr-like helicase
MTRDELVECAALVRAVKRGGLDRLFPPVAPLDILAQQVVAEVACEEWREDDLYDCFRKAWPYKDLSRDDYSDVIELESEGIGVGSGRVAHYIHRDRINSMLRGRRGARMTAIQCGGAIPEIADYRVIAEPEGAFVGTLDEDFSVESMAGDIVLLGTTSWRIKRIEAAGIVRVENAHGAPPTIPFWNGEGPGRTLELSEEVSDLRIELGERISGGNQGTIEWAMAVCGLPREAAEQMVQYVTVQQEMLGVVPSQKDVVFERFFDESGGMQLVVHAPFGMRINRAWGFALRKRFCVSFDFELQAAASDDAMLLSIGPNNSFPLEDMFGLVKKPWLRESVEQSLLIANAPAWQSRWRWNTTRALAILRQRNGKRVPPQLQRMKADDLMAAVFPVLVACQENLQGPIELPDHPLTRQTMHDCLTEAMDIEGLEDVLDRVEAGEIKFHARDTTEPSPFSHEMINSKPYTYLDDAPLEERRARAVTLRRALPKSGRDLGILDPDAIEVVVAEAQPQPRDPEEVHDALLGLVALRPEFAPDWQDWVEALVDQRRASIVETHDGERLWFAAENLPLIEVLYPGAAVKPEIRLPLELRHDADEDGSRAAIVRGHLEVVGPTTVSELMDRTALPEAAILSALARLEGEGGMAMRGRFRVTAEEEEWCDRRLLARIHRYTLDRLRSEIEPVSSQDLMRFLLRWQHVAQGTQLHGKRGLLEAIAQVQGIDIPVVAWERHILPARVSGYKGGWLDELCMSGDVAWARLAGRKSDNGRAASASSATPITLARRADLPWLAAGVRNGSAPSAPSTGAAAEIYELLSSRGALFYDDIVAATRRLPTDVERGVWDLVARGLATADGFQALRSLMATTKKRSFRRPQRARLFRTLAVSGVPSGRWSLLPITDLGGGWPEGSAAGEQSPEESKLTVEDLAEAWVEQLLFRYGVVFRDLVKLENFTVPWREILRALRRMEAQGVVRGGRFVSGYYGEQYARPEAVESLRQARRNPKTGELVRVSAVDPLNLTGIITSTPRVPSVHTKTVVFRDGIHISGEEAMAGATERRELVASV